MQKHKTLRIFHVGELLSKQQHTQRALAEGVVTFVTVAADIAAPVAIWQAAAWPRTKYPPTCRKAALDLS